MIKATVVRSPWKLTTDLYLYGRGEDGQFWLAEPVVPVLKSMSKAEVDSGLERSPFLSFSDAAGDVMRALYEGFREAYEPQAVSISHTREDFEYERRRLDRAIEAIIESRSRR